MFIFLILHEWIFYHYQIHFSLTNVWKYSVPSFHPVSQNAWSHLFEVVLPPLVTIRDVQGVQVFQGTSVISEGHLGYPLQDLIKILLTLSLQNSKNNISHVHRPTSKHLGVLESVANGWKVVGLWHKMFCTNDFDDIFSTSVHKKLVFPIGVFV